MKIVIIGGSNSQLSSGYQEHLRRTFPQMEVVNLSVGAAPSLMGIYRLLSTQKAAPGDLLIWEYALNDLNHIAGKGYEPQLLLRYVEYTIRYAARYNLALLPLIFLPKRIENQKRPHPYRNGLQTLFDHYGLTPVDMSSELRIRSGQSPIPDSFYRDVNHFHICDEFLAPILSATADILAAPEHAKPRLVAPLIVSDDRFPKVHSQPETGQEDAFINSLMQIPAWSVASGPVIFGSLSPKAELIGLLVMASTDGGAIRLRAGETDVTLSLCHDERKFGKPLLKLIALPNLLNAETKLGPDRSVRFDRANHDASTLYDMGFRPVETTPDQDTHGRIIALLTEGPIDSTEP